MRDESVRFDYPAPEQGPPRMATVQAAHLAHALRWATGDTSSRTFRMRSTRLLDLLWCRFIVCPPTSANNRLKSSVDWTIRWQFLFDTFLRWSQRTHAELQFRSTAPPHGGPARQRIAPVAVAVATQPGPKRLTTVQPIRLRPVSNINGQERLPLVS